VHYAIIYLHTVTDVKPMVKHTDVAVVAMPQLDFSFSKLLVLLSTAFVVN